MDVETLIRSIVRDEIEAAIGPRAAADPILLTPGEAADLCGIGKPAIYDLCAGAPINGFPVVRLGTRHLKIDKARLVRWLATGGIGVAV